MLEDIQEIQTEPMVIFCDNKSAIAIAKNPIHHGRTKHIDTRFHFIRGLIEEGAIKLIHCSTDIQVADILTKAMSIRKHAELRELMGVKIF